MSFLCLIVVQPCEHSISWRSSSRRGSPAILQRTLLLKCVIVFLVLLNVLFRRRSPLWEASLNHYLSAAKGLSVDDLRELRHAPVLGLSTLFPDASLWELNEKHHKALQTKALLQSTTKKETPKKLSFVRSRRTTTLSKTGAFLRLLASSVL